MPNTGEFHTLSALYSLKTSYLRIFAKIVQERDCERGFSCFEWQRLSLVPSAVLHTEIQGGTQRQSELNGIRKQPPHPTAKTLVRKQAVLFIPKGKNKLFRNTPSPKRLLHFCYKFVKGFCSVCPRLFLTQEVWGGQ